MRALVGLLFASGLSLGSALAAELPVGDVLYGPAYRPAYVAPVPVIFGWTGLYIGAHGAYAGGIPRCCSNLPPTSEFNCPAQSCPEFHSGVDISAGSSATITS